MLDIKAGTDMIMPDANMAALHAALKDGKLTRADLEAPVKRTLSTYLKLV